MGQKNDENIMGTGRVPAILLKMGIPIIVSMVLQAMYNIVDSMFVSRMPDLPNLEHTGEYAVNALTLAFPIQMLIVAFGIGTGVGVGAMLSRLLGMKDTEGVAKTAGNGVFLGIFISAAFVVFGLFGIDPYLKSQTQDPVIFSMGRSYLRICTYLCLGNVLWGVYEKLLQSTGKTMLSTAAQITGALTNIVMDPIMIYGLLGCPAMGDEVLEEGDFEPFISDLESSLKGKKVGLFGSYGWGDGQWMRDWAERMEKAGAEVLGGEGVICNDAPDDSAKADCQELGKALAAL